MKGELLLTAAGITQPCLKITYKGCNTDEEFIEFHQKAYEIFMC